MIIMYTSDECKHCDHVKQVYDSAGVEYVQLEGAMLKNDHDLWRESGIALVVAELAMQDWDGELPVVIERDAEVFEVHTYQEWCELHRVSLTDCEGGSCHIRIL